MDVVGTQMLVSLDTHELRLPAFERNAGLGNGMNWAT